MPKRRVYKRDSKGRFAPTGKSRKSGRKAKGITALDAAIKYELAETKYVNQKGRKDKAFRRVVSANRIHQAVTGSSHYNYGFMTSVHGLRKDILSGKKAPLWSSTKGTRKRKKK